jgi:SAM-dependent methyltransferase
MPDNSEELNMTVTQPAALDVPRLRDQVRATYERVALELEGEFRLHRGPAYAATYLSYDRAELARLPEEATARFAGVGNPLCIGPIRAGETVLDHACGAGMDLLLAARRVGPRGRAIGVDMTPGMRASALLSAEQAGLSDIVEVREGTIEDLPVDDQSVDVVISNGVVNLSPDKARVFEEIYRVLKPGGRLYLADVVVQRRLQMEARNHPDLWAACIGGALPQAELAELAAGAGLRGGRIVEWFDCFRDTSVQRSLSKDLRPLAVNFYAAK